MEHEPQQHEEAPPETPLIAGEIADDEHQEPSEQPPEIIPRIYVASLTDYNEGRLHGTWLEAAQDVDALEDAISGMLNASPSGHAEEWAIHDFEGFNGLHLGEWENLNHVSHIAKGIAEHGIAFAHWATLVATDEDLNRFEDVYLGHWASLKDYALDIFDEAGVEHTLEKGVSERLRSYVTLDASAYGRDLLLGGDILAAEGDGGVYVFSGRW